MNRKNETFHSSSSKLDFEVDGEDLVIRKSDDADDEDSELALSEGPVRGLRKSLSKNGLVSSTRNLIRRNSRENLMGGLSRSNSNSSLSKTSSRRGAVLSRSNLSLQDLADGTEKESSPKRKLDRRALLLGSRGSSWRNSGHNSYGDLHAPTGRRKGSFRDLFGSPSDSTASTPRRKGSMRNLFGGSDDDNISSSRSREKKKSGQKKNKIEISHEETLAILLAQEFENFDC